MTLMARDVWWLAASQEVEKTLSIAHMMQRVNWERVRLSETAPRDVLAPSRLNLLEVQQHLPNSPNCRSGVQNVGPWHRSPIQTAILSL